MLSVQRMAEIAAGYLTTMADAMIRACVQWAVDNDADLVVPERKARRGTACVDREPREYEGVDWEQMVRGNSDIVGPRR